MAEAMKRKFSYEGRLSYDVGDTGVDGAHWEIGDRYEIDELLLAKLFGEEATKIFTHGKKIKITLEEL